MSDVGDRGYTDISLSPDNKALNPLINSGALTILEILSRTHTVDELASSWKKDGENFNLDAVSTTLADS